MKFINKNQLKLIVGGNLPIPPIGIQICQTGQVIQPGGLTTSSNVATYGIATVLGTPAANAGFNGVTVGVVTDYGFFPVLDNHCK